MARKSKKTVRRKTRRVGPIPPGLGTVTPHLVIEGASKAIVFYRRAFGAQELERSEMPDGKLLHASIKIGDSIVMMSDEFPGADARAPTVVGTSTVTLHIYARNVDKLWQQAIAAGGKPTMPLENQFWGERYGKLVDPFGHHWSLSMRVRMSREERERKRQEAMMMFEKGEHPAPPTQSK